MKKHHHEAITTRDRKRPRIGARVSVVGYVGEVVDERSVNLFEFPMEAKPRQSATSGGGR